MTDFGASGIVDQAIKGIVTQYDDLGRVRFVTSRGGDLNSDGLPNVILNEVGYVYNSWGQVYREYQNHQDEVDSGTPYVQYNYGDGASSGVAEHVRLESVTYPNGREISYGYGSTGAVDDIMSRLAAISDTGGTLASYKYLGAGTIVREDYEQPDVALDYDPDGDNSFTGLDRFGRVADQLWADDSWDPVDEYKYAYDRSGNRLSRDNAVAPTNSNLDEKYSYDALNRLTDTDRGYFTGTTFTKAADYQSWGLDGLGNFSTFTDQGTTQNRTSNAANEIQSISGTWAEPTYDAAGNMISAPKSGDEATRLHFVYDAWNR